MGMQPVMRKQVTFVESLTKDKGVQWEHGPETRSAEASSCTSNGCEFVKKSASHITVSAGNKPFHFPTYMTTSPFLQHHFLTAGQRRYLHSITSIYSTEQMRRQMKQHYLDVLHSCLQSGQIPVTRRRFRQESSEKEAKAKSQGRKKSSSTSTHSNIRLPKIVNR